MMRSHSTLINYIRKSNAFIKIQSHSNLYQTHKLLSFCSEAPTSNMIKEVSLDDLLSSSALIDAVPNQNKNIMQPILLNENTEPAEDKYVLDEDSDAEIDEIINDIIDETAIDTNTTALIETTKSKHDYLSPVPEIATISHSTFESMNLRKKLQNNLSLRHGLSPLPIQSLAFDKIMEFKSNYAMSASIIESRMGTGKTLAYLLPILNDLKPLQCGQVVIVIPSNELGLQIKAMIKSYLYDTDNYKHNHATSSYFANNQNQNKKNKQFNVQHCVLNCNSNESLDYNIDYINKMKPSIIIATPKRIRQLLLYSIIKPSKMNYIVFDEIDSLFPTHVKNVHKNKDLVKKYLNHSHLKPAQLILNGIIKQQSNVDSDNHKCHALFVGATISNQLKNTIQQILQPYPVQLISTYPAQNNYVTDNKTHIPKRFISPNIQHQYIAVDNSKDKPLIAAELINTIRSDPKKKKVYNPAVLIVVNKDSSPMHFAESLSENDIKCALLHEYINDKTMRSKFLKLFRQGTIDAVIATETVCRGLDFIWLDHIICAEMPYVDTSYLHICGRCSRLESKGFITSIVDEFEEERLKRYCFKYQIDLTHLDDKLEIEKLLTKQKRKYNKINTFPLLLQNKEYQKKLKQQFYLTSQDNKNSVQYDQYL